MSQPISGQTALTDEENVMWVPEPLPELTEEEVYWRLRGMFPPARVTLEE